ncbi:Homeobox protein ATH1 [Spatholobus suberectus]|nr:Homeobox protein ATH1 [Spatholobus suberectus]
METDMYIAPLDISGRDATVMDEISQHSTSNPLIQCYSLDLNNQSHIINGISMLSGEQGEPISDVHADACFINPSIIADSSQLATSLGKTIVGDSSNPMENTELQEHLVGGMPITPSSLAAILAARIGLEENLENSSALPPSLCSMGALGPFFNNLQGTSNPFSATFEDCGYNEGRGKWNANKFPKAPGIDGTCQPYSSIANLDPDEWAPSNVANMANHAYHSSNFSKELSLSLATSTTTGQCSELSCSNVTPCMNGAMSGLEQASCSSSRELSMNLGGNKYVPFSPEVLESRYLVGIQEILAQIARYSFENLEQLNYSAAGNRAGGNEPASAFPPNRRILIDHNADSMHETHAESPLQRHAAESKKAQLLTLLQLVDNRYSQCLDEIHTVVSAFHAATELDPQVHAHFALQTISILYKDLRERIGYYILDMGSNFNNSCSEENEWSVETSFLQKQWALQQLKRKDHQLWRPQRGLPERSVSVLRTWMFQNFLHPYPKDAEKHLLAVKSGLTRSQVSNWFINARVRLWKPMIEEMYAEMNKRKACRNEEGMQSNHGNRISMSNQRFNVN